MSYSRSYRGTVTGSVTGTVSYPASQNGGSESVTLTYSRDVTWDVIVETEPFDESVDKCENHINLLTGAVVATQGLAVAAKKEAADKVGQTLVDGFFGHVRSEIEQQMTILKSRIDSLALHLATQAKKCRSLNAQMDQDFARIASRYIKLFGDLDQEMKRRIQGIDQASFELAADATERIASERSASGALVPSITAQESQSAKNAILISALKKRTMDMVRSVSLHTATDREIGDALQSVLDEPLDEAAERRAIYVPAIHLSADDTSGSGVRSAVHLAGVDFPGVGRAKGALESPSVTWQEIPEAGQSEIERHWMRRLGAWSAEQNGEAAARAATMMKTLWEKRSRQ